MSPKKKDPSVTSLNTLGYNVIKNPRTGIAPLDVIGKSTVVRYIGPLSTLWTSDRPAPAPGPPDPSSSIIGKHSDAVDLNFGVSLLANALAVFGMSAPSLDLSHTGATGLQFSYADVSLVSVNLGVIGDYLAKGRFQNPDSPTVKNYFADLNASVYLITQVLRSTSITVTALDSHSNAVALNLPEIQGVVGAKVAVKPSNESTATLTFSSSGDKPIAVNFGFQAIRLKLVGDLATGSFTFDDPTGDISFGIAPGAAAPETIETGVLETGPESCLLDI
jgi:hypothetical protein